VLWNDLTDKFALFNEGDVIKIDNAYSRDNAGRKELHLTGNSALVVNPPGITIKVSPMQQTEPTKGLRKQIKDLAENDNNIELLATIVQVYDPRFFEVCPECGRRAKGDAESGYKCETHGTVDPKFRQVLNIHLDDGTGNTRAVLWAKQVLDLVGMSDEQFLKFKESPAEFETKKTELLGNIVKFVGRVNKNQTFDSIEFVVQHVEANPNPEEELKRLDRTAEESVVHKKTVLEKPKETVETEELKVEADDAFSIDDL
jgi:hypothetical protein